MKPLLHILFLLLAFTAGARPHTYDVVIVGGTPAGITAAVAAARASIVGGFKGTANLLAAKLYDLPAIGTAASNARTTSADSRSTDWAPRTSPRGAPRRGCSPASSC